MEILSYPIGLLVGMLPVVTSPGPGGPATVLLDGSPACTVTAEAPQCMVDLGPELRLHLVELVRTDASGRVTQRARRWINRPGAQAEAYLRGACDAPRKDCSFTFGWGHPGKLEPRAMTVTVNGEIVLREVRRSWSIPYEPSPAPVVASLDVTFPDGRRASQTIAVGGVAHAAVESVLTPVPIVPTGDIKPDALAPATLGGHSVRAVEEAPAEVAFVVEPLALEAVRGLWEKSKAELLVRGRRPDQEAMAPLLDIEAMTAVVPNQNLNRFDVFRRSEEREIWLRKLTHGASALEGTRMRLADAVASAGQLVAGAPRSRAVVLVVSGRHPDASNLGPQQAVAHLNEIMVPLIVWRLDGASAEGWPVGPKVTSRSIGEAIKAVRTLLDRQRIAWLDGDVSPDALALAPQEIGFAIAGRTDSTRLPVPAPGAPLPQAVAVAPTATPAPAQARVNVTAVRIVVRATDPTGAPVTQLAPTDLVVREEGREATVLNVERLAGAGSAPPAGPAAATTGMAAPARWQVVVYAIPELCGHANLTRSAARLRDTAAGLATLGPVTVVVADPEPTVVAEGLTEAAAVAAALSSAKLTRPGGGRIERIRSAFLADLDIPKASFQSGPDLYRRLVERSLVATRSEASVVKGNLARLVAWARRDPRQGAKLLALVMDGFDITPGEFYLSMLSPPQAKESQTEYRRAQQDFRATSLATSVREVAAGLAERGWTLMTIDNGASSRGFSSSTEHGGDTTAEAFWNRGDASPGGAATPTALFLQPRAPLAQLAEATGGTVAPPTGSLAGVLDQLSRAYLVTYQVDRPADGRLHALTVATSRANAVIRAPEQVLSGTSTQESETRALALLAGGKGIGELSVMLLLDTGPSAAGDRLEGRLEARTRVVPLAAALEALGSATFRVTLAVAFEGADPFVHHDERLVPAAGTGKAWIYEAPIDWPRHARQLAVVVEELSTGTWGGSTAELASP